MVVLVTGGSGSGKSEYAEHRAVALAQSISPLIYIATMRPYGNEAAERIKRHRKMRDKKGFETMECFTGLKNCFITSNSVVLLECMSNLAANEMFEEVGAHAQAEKEIIEGIEVLMAQCRHLIVVTNEISFEGLEQCTEELLSYQKLLGNLNRNLAARSDECVEVVYSIPIWLKQRKEEMK